MKKKFILLLTSLLLIGCGTPHNSTSIFNSEVNSDVSTNEVSSVSESSSEKTTTINQTSEKVSSINSTSEKVSSATPSSEKVSSEKPSSSSESTVSSSSSEETVSLLSLGEILTEGKKLANDEKGIKVALEATYISALTDNLDKLMLFTDGNNYVYVRVVGGFNDFLKNRYLDCDYHVEGTLTYHNGNVEVIYSSLVNLTSTPKTISLEKVTENKTSLSEVVEEYKTVILNNKDTGFGKIVTFKGTIITTEYTDSNSKLVVYDGVKTITVVSNKKIVNKEDVGKEFEITGAISILKSSPSIWCLETKYVKDSALESLNFESVKEVSPSYFSKWYYVSDKINKPSIDDFTTLYKVTGYLADDYSRTSAGKFYLGMTDEFNGNLQDNGVKTSIKGIYLMNQQGLTSTDLSYSVFEPYYEEEKVLSIYASLYQFDTQNHAWKMFSIEGLVK